MQSSARTPKPRRKDSATTGSSGEISSAQRVYEWLREAILNGKFAPGQTASIYWLAEELGVSRTPAREAVLKLATLGVVEIERNRGFSVRRLSVEEVREIYEARILFEVPAARAAARYPSSTLINTLYHHLEKLDEHAGPDQHVIRLAWDRSLHTEILHAGENSRVIALAEGLRDSSIQAWEIYSDPGVSADRDVAKEHLELVNAIADGDAELAARKMQDHLESNALYVMQRVAEINGESVPVRFVGRMLG